MKGGTILFVVVSLTLETVRSFSASPIESIVDSIKSAFESTISKAGGSNDAEDVRRRDELKASLLQKCRQTATKPSRDCIEALINDLVGLSPTPNAAGSDRLQKQWNL